MPFMRVTHARGALSEAQKAQLAEGLTAAMLIAEGGADTPAGRAVAYIVFNAVDTQDWYVGGRPDTNPPPGGRFVVDIVFPVGAASQPVKSELHRAANEVIARVLGVDGAFPKRATDWILIHEVPDGNWGASGVTVGIEEIAGVIAALPERASFFRPLLAAQRRLREANGFPPGTGR